MATVYLGRARGKAGFEKRVAVKVIHPHLANEPDLVGMFLDEARIAADIHHPHVVETLDLGEDDGVYFMVMEFIEGETLSALMRAMAPATLPLALALQVVADACEGLNAAHSLRDAQGKERNLVHRDVSPQNLMLSMDGWVKVADFGIMKAAGKTSHTRPGELRGKLAYMSPEQARGNGVDHRTDLFALGVITWELCTGERLFSGDTDAATLEKVMRCEIPSFELSQCSELDGADPELGAKLGAFFKRALASDPDERFQTGADMLEQLHVLQRLVGHRRDARRRLAELMGEKFEKRAEYLRASMRDGSPLRKTTRKRSSMVEIARAAESVTANVADVIDDATTSPPTVTTTLAGAPARAWWLWLLLPAVGAALAVGMMSFGQNGEANGAAPVVDPSPAVVEAAETAAPDEPRTVRWQFTTTPPGATIIVGGEVHSQPTPTEVMLPAGEEAIKVVLEKEGFVTRTDMLVPRSDQNFPYELRPVEAVAEKEESKVPSKTKKKKGTKSSDSGGAGDTAAPASDGNGDDKPVFKPSPFPDGAPGQR
jgi:serine/threonine-protein kinase